MRRVLVFGHRGAGKSSFLQRVARYYNRRRLPVLTLDLDAEIAGGEGMSVARIFREHGEARFRDLETTYWRRLQQNLQQVRCDAFVAVGGGFAGEIPANFAALQLARASDRLGRIFLNRPRLRMALAPLQEAQEIFHEREQAWQKRTHQTWIVPEGLSASSAAFSAAEEKWLFNEISDLGGVVTILPQHLRDSDFLLRRAGWGTRFELRDDLLSAAEISFCMQHLPPRDLILSLRRGSADSLELISGVGSADMDVELVRRHPDWADVVRKKNVQLIVSIHQRGPQQAVSDILAGLEREQADVIKLAIPIANFAECAVAYKWWTQKPECRAFLPRSEDGRWQWLRLLLARRMPLNFWREDSGSAIDQPTLAQWLQVKSVLDRNENIEAPTFAAVLGDPVVHSWTPEWHQDFFAQRGRPVVAVRVPESEMTVETLDFLTELGLRAAAVTAPLKKRAAELAGQSSEMARKLGVANTLAFSGGQNPCWLADNTDIDGLREIVPLLSGDVAIWGGGGMLPVIDEVLPQVKHFSARVGAGPNDLSPDTLIWAVGRGSFHGATAAQWPPAHWRPLRIIDLNYSEDSPGKEYAGRVGSEYFSGAAMFEAQARAQQGIWSEHVR